MKDLTGGGWEAWQRHVLSELKRLSQSSEDMAKTQTDIRLEIERLKLKARFWGALAGAIPSAVLLLLQYLQEHGK